MVQGMGCGMNSVIVNVVDKVPGREADMAPMPAHQIHRHYHLLQPLYKNHLPLQSNFSPLLDLHTTDMMCLGHDWPRLPIAMPTTLNLALVVIGTIDDCAAISSNYVKLCTSTKS
jgi:hypothetical protein